MTPEELGKLDAFAEALKSISADLGRKGLPAVADSIWEVAVELEILGGFHSSVVPEPPTRPTSKH